MSSRVYAYLTVSGFSCEPNAITALVGLPMARLGLSGDRTRGDRLVTENTWSSQPPVPPGEEQPDYYVSAILDHIATRSAELTNFLRSHSSGINCVGEFRRINGGFHMSQELVSRCASLGLWLDFDLYNFTMQDER
ncbi:hypothetical protein [Lysobacter sp. Root916]|uniref:hypothetical protein n=1 Tax=Lysobacter sp. Root916 TaxID=1736606 RepID=UPI0012F8B5E3|nr:hypothetical protein [Lysobacter sp. Root916]